MTGLGRSGVSDRWNPRDGSRLEGRRLEQWYSSGGERRRFSKEPRIVAGTGAGDGEFPFMVSLRVRCARLDVTHVLRRGLIFCGIRSLRFPNSGCARLSFVWGHFD